MFKFLNYTMGNKYNNPLDTQNYKLSVPSEINFTCDREYVILRNLFINKFSFKIFNVLVW